MKKFLVSATILLVLISSMVLSLSIDELKSNVEKIKKEKLNLKFLQGEDPYDENNDQNLTFEQIVVKKGYPLSSHFVETGDGYILKIFRISGPKNSLRSQSEDSEKKIVLLQHGLVDSCDSWIAHHEAKALPFLLANLGFDVWLGNNRGNKYSRSHLKYNPDKDKEFWQYSFHEMGLHDIPAIINHIKKETKSNRKITYIGHSQGTSQIFAGLILIPDFYRENLNGLIGLGPVTNLGNVNSTLLKILVDFDVDILFEKLGMKEIFESTYVTSKLEKFLCKTIGILCEGLLELISDFNYKDDDLDRFITFLAHFPSGSSVQTFLHFAQNIRSKSFSTFKEMVPYDFSKAPKIPISLLVGKDDRLATVADNRNLKMILEQHNLLDFYKEYENTGHLSFFISMTNVFIDDVLKKVDEYSSLS